MKKKISEAPNDPSETPRWEYEKSVRVRPLWEVVALSMGVNPTQAVVTEKKRDTKWLETYRIRLKHLALKLSDVPTRGHVTSFPDHRYRNKSKPARWNMIVDVVTAIDVLLCLPDSVGADGKLKELRDAIQSVPLAPDKLSIDSKEEGKGRRQDQTPAITTKQLENARIFVYALAKLNYDYSATASAKEKAEVIDRILGALESLGLKKYGLGKDAIGNLLDAAKNDLTSAGFKV